MPQCRRHCEKPSGTWNDSCDHVLECSEACYLVVELLCLQFQQPRLERHSFPDHVENARFGVKFELQQPNVLIQLGQTLVAAPPHCFEFDGLILGYGALALQDTARQNGSFLFRRFREQRLPLAQEVVEAQGVLNGLFLAFRESSG